MLVAYIDPVLGSMLIQAVAAVGLAGAVVFRRVLFAPLVWLGLKNTDQPDREGEASPDKD